MSTEKRDAKIVELSKAGLTQQLIATRFGLQQKAVSEILKRARAAQ